MTIRQGIEFEWNYNVLQTDVIDPLLNDCQFLIDINTNALSSAIAQGQSPAEIERLTDIITNLKNKQTEITNYRNSLVSDMYNFKAIDNSAQRLLSMLSLQYEYSFGALPAIT